MLRGQLTLREVKQQVYSDVQVMLASCANKCGRCYVVLRTLTANHHVNDCPAAMAMAPHYRARLSILSTGPVAVLMPCIHDFGYHAADECPLGTEATLARLNAVKGLCSQCWLADDGFESFVTHSADGGPTYGGDQCRSAHGRDFIRDAVFALFHAFPEYLAHHMREWDKWNRVPKGSDHTCVSYTDKDLTPHEMPSLEVFALWAKERWDQRMAVSNGVVLLLHFMRFTDGGSLVQVRDHDYRYWKTLCMIGKLRKGSS